MADCRFVDIAEFPITDFTVDLWREIVPLENIHDRFVNLTLVRIS